VTEDVVRSRPGVERVVSVVDADLDTRGAAGRGDRDTDAVPAANLRTDTAGVDLERLHVASQAVLDWIAESGVDVGEGSPLDQLAHHARALVDMRCSPASPFAATRAHALRVRNELVVLATERSLTLAVWFDDALGVGSCPSRVITADPAEDGG